MLIIFDVGSISFRIDDIILLDTDHLKHQYKFFFFFFSISLKILIVEKIY